MNIKGISSLLIVSFAVAAVSCRENNIGPRPVQVKVMQSSATAADGIRNYSGTTNSAVSTNLSFGIPGIVKKVHVSEGQKVKKGDRLAEIDDVSYKSAYTTAKSMLDQAQDAYDRLKVLHDKQALADIKWVEIESKLTQAKSMLDVAEKELSNCRITAPINGTISVCNIEEGQYCVPASTAFTIIDPDNMMCTFSVPEKEINLFQKGMEAKVVIPSIDNSVIPGTVSKVGTSADMLTHTYEIGVQINGQPGVMRPGMICKIAVKLQSNAGSINSPIVLPSSVIMLDYDNTHYVWVAQGDTVAVRRNIEIGKAVSDGITIEGGLDGSENIITDGILKVSEGCRIVICE